MQVERCSEQEIMLLQIFCLCFVYVLYFDVNIPRNWKYWHYSTSWGRCCLFSCSALHLCIQSYLFDICSWSIRDHSCCLFNHLYLQSFLRHWPSSLVLVHPGQSYLVQLLYGLSAFFTTSRHQRHDAVQSTWRWSLYLHCYIGDQRGWWQRQLQVHDHTCRNTPAFLLSSSQDCQDDRCWERFNVFYHLQRA